MFLVIISIVMSGRAMEYNKLVEELQLSKMAHAHSSQVVDVLGSQNKRLIIEQNKCEAANKCLTETVASLTKELERMQACEEVLLKEKKTLEFTKMKMLQQFEDFKRLGKGCLDEKVKLKDELQKLKKSVKYYSHTNATLWEENKELQSTVAEYKQDYATLEECLTKRT